MKIDGQDGLDLIVIGENIHTTRVLLRRGKRVVGEGDEEAIAFTTVDGEPALLVLPEALKKTQDYQEGRVKHVQVAVNAAMSGDGAETGLAYLRQLARNQEDAGATFLDINVDEISWKLDEQKAAMDWLVRAVRGMSDLPVSVDSSNVEVIETGLKACDGAPAMLNSASLERLDALDMAAEYNAQVVVTAAGESGMPDGTEERVVNASRMVDAALAKGFELDHIHIDPLVFPVSVDKVFGTHCLDAIRRLRAAYGPEVHITGGMSNVSFGIPARRIVNDVFLVMAVAAGADGGIVDPVASPPAKTFAADRDSLAYRLAQDLLEGRDEHCRNYIGAWRKGELEAFGAPPPKRRGRG